MKKQTKLTCIHFHAFILYLYCCYENTVEKLDKKNKRWKYRHLSRAKMTGKGASFLRHEYQGALVITFF